MRQTRRSAVNVLTVGAVIIVIVIVIITVAQRRVEHSPLSDCYDDDDVVFTQLTVIRLTH